MIERQMADSLLHTTVQLFLDEGVIDAEALVTLAGYLPCPVFQAPLETAEVSQMLVASRAWRQRYTDWLGIAVSEVALVDAPVDVLLDAVVAAIDRLDLRVESSAFVPKACLLNFLQDLYCDARLHQMLLQEVSGRGEAAAWASFFTEAVRSYTGLLDGLTALLDSL